MPANAQHITKYGPIEVAPNLDLRRSVMAALRKYDRMTAVEIANWAYYGRAPHDVRLGLRWWTNASQQSATRRALAALMADGRVAVIRKVGAVKIYGIARSTGARRDLKANKR